MTSSPRPPILKPDESYTFRRYFEMKFAIDDDLVCKASSMFYQNPELSNALLIACLK